jgi:small ligand-binding sensory domain FIST
MTRGHLAFRPLRQNQPQQFFWSVDAAWGEIRWTENAVELTVAGGCLPLRSLAVPEARQVSQAWLDQTAVDCTCRDQTLHFSGLEIPAGSTLKLVVD